MSVVSSELQFSFSLLVVLNTQRFALGFSSKPSILFKYFFIIFCLNSDAQNFSLARPKAIIRKLSYFNSPDVIELHVCIKSVKLFIHPLPID